MAPRKARAPKAAALPPSLPAGLVVTDLTRRTWRIDAPIGSGGFGLIYGATAESAPPAAGAQYVIKVESHGSGPLFSEMHCYMRVARAETIAAWKKAHGLKKFGMPQFVASGSFDHGGQKFRFMVIERYGTDLQKLLEQNNHRFPMATILHIGIQVLDVLEFLHSQEYIHGDIKGQNLLLGLDKDTKDLVHLVDFGLACRYAFDGVHKEYKPDVRKAHNGTIEFTSRDAHIGAQSRRGDLEILGYNLLQWASGTLPWMDRLQNAERVADEKNRLMANVPALVKACFKNGMPKGADTLQRFLAAVAALKFDEQPNYSALRGVLHAGLKSLGNPPARLVFVADSDMSSPRSSGRAARDRSPLHTDQEPASSRRRPAAAAKRGGRGRGRAAAVSSHSSSEGEEEEEEEPPPQPLVNGRGGGKGAKGGARGKKRASEESPEENGAAPGRSNGAGKKARVNGKADSAKSSANSSSTGSIYDNINPAMQEVLDKRAKAAEKAKAKPKQSVAKSKLKSSAATSAASRAAKGRAAAVAADSPSGRAAGRRVASPGRGRAGRPAVPDTNGDSEDSFHTPSGAPAPRRSGRLSGSGALSPLAQPRRAIRGADLSPELW
ncbi:serine/threonine-protein kinase VRK1-like [Amphibalanus amphitrite]|uniref:serine/threonine-protein kinase VRK1-like n=1 Tax=Amphibalanus amphitrite TaxID=1232801 RepID=UPI001C8FC799|nr:serine/threonine-protein kinase VRK1-like [Amphibalanus amphitrite]